MALFLHCFIDVKVEKPEKKMTFKEEFSWVRLRNVKKQARMLGRCESYLQNLKLSLTTHSLTDRGRCLVMLSHLIKIISDGCSIVVL